MRIKGAIKGMRMNSDRPTVTMSWLFTILLSAMLALAPGSLPAQQPTPRQIENFKRLSPPQQAAINEELAKTGGKLTPEAMEALKLRPEFQGLSPEDIVKGKEILEKQEAVKKEAEKAKLRGELREPERKDREKTAELKEPGMPEKAFEPARAETDRRVVEEENRRQSLYDRSRQIRKYQDIPLDLKPFGYDFFREAAVKVITDRRDIPVPLKYVVGPGDEVRLILWGRINASHTLTVDRDGKIAIPNIGPVTVAGMTFEQMSRLLIKQAEQITGTNVDISLGALRTIPIFILGDVRRPGAYNIGASATMTDALLLAGGPSEIGSMRKIQLKRSNKLVRTLDLYDLLLKGDKSQDMTLRGGDIIFVPVIGPYVGIAGNVKRPALYELKDKSSLEQVIELAGGVIPSAFTQQLQVERTIKNEKQVVIDIDDKHLSKIKTFMLQDSDLVKIFSIVDKKLNVINLSGNVKRGGTYAFKPGMRLKDILKDEMELLAETHLDYALIKRLGPPGTGSVLVPFNIGELVLSNKPETNIELQPQDSIFIFSKWFFRDKPFFTISGEVRQPGRIDLADNLKVKDAILAAGGLTRDAYLEKGEVIRVDSKKQYRTMYFDVEKAMKEDHSSNLLLQDQDEVILHSVWGNVYKSTVTVSGDVKNPGDVQLTDKMSVKDLVFKAGNILESAYLDEAEIISLTTAGGKTASRVKRNINLRKALAGDPAHNIILNPHDHLFVKRIPEWRAAKFVKISGELPFPGSYPLMKGEKISSLIERAGGYTPHSYLRAAVFTRERVREMQQKGLLEMADRLERELLASSAGQVGTALSTEEVAARKVEAEQRLKFIQSLRELKATGRMTIQLGQLRLFKGSAFDIELEEDDHIFIPQKNSVVNIAGASMTQASLIYSDKMSFEDYIEATGGYSRFADKSNVFVMKVDGSARKLSRGFFNWSDKRARWEITGSGEQIPPIEAGDTIVVPEKLERIAWLREIRDITQIMMNVAVAAAVVIKLW